MKSLPSPVAALVLASGLSLHAVAAPPSYPLRVRDGAALRFQMESIPAQSRVKLIIEFRPGSRKAAAGLGQGQGSWLDRGMRAGEPTRLEYVVDETEAQRIREFLRTSASYYTFECFNTGNGYLQVTKAYPKSVKID